MVFRVYYLDDEVDLVNLFKAFFVDETFEVTTFTDAADAIACCQIAPPYVFFIDYRLADTTGDKVASLVDINIKKILLTGDINMVEHPLFETIIKKPFMLSHIKSVIDEIYTLANTKTG